MTNFFKHIFNRHKPCDAFKVAQIFCQMSNWKLNNLELQKLLYIAQVFSLGLRKKPLFKNKITAWRYGPIVDGVFTQLRICGTQPIEPFMFIHHVEYECNEDDIEFIDMMSFLTKDLKDWQLIGLVHQPETAWKRTISTYGLFSEIKKSWMIDEFKKVYESKLAKEKLADKTSQ